jgi:hypothetical protein
MCAKLHESIIRMKTKTGIKEYSKFSNVIPSFMMKIIKWKGGDNLAFDYQREGDDFCLMVRRRKDF